MKTKAKAVHVYTLRLWSKKHFIEKGTIVKPKGTDYNIWAGSIKNNKTREKTIMFHRIGDLIKAIEKMYDEDENR